MRVEVGGLMAPSTSMTLPVTSVPAGDASLARRSAMSVGLAETVQRRFATISLRMWSFS